MKQQPIFADWIAQRPNESDEAWEKRVRAAIVGDDVRVKTDLKGFKSCDFTLAPERSK